MIRIALPLAMTAVLQQLFNAADIAVVGRFVGEGAMAAVGGNAPVIGLVVNLFTGLSLGANVVLSQMIGQGDHCAGRSTPRSCSRCWAACCSPSGASWRRQSSCRCSPCRRRCAAWR